MELFSYFRSSAAYRVRIALNLKQIEHSIVPVNLLNSEQRGAEYMALQPQGLVPALRLADGRVISQSTAILEYLEAVFPAHPLLPADPYQAAQVRSWANLIACDIHPLDNLRVLKYLKHKLGVSDPEKDSWYQHWILEGFRALESQLVAAPYAAGAQVTLAEVYLVPQVYNALRFNTDLGEFPKIRSIYAACNELPAFQQAAPEQQVDCP
ncbi:maleylacetoacetate isomerase [Pseudomaricurvus alcaniphilus]|uniref:maleylacetoacetate isomerase n=1 Tax=Pseudomaricurvus alcaniphilus TaxID=1166482 RepID=UPI00140960C6|nr:maleylacetoacetate isomerase [Pseudomaricurvus alcaniphilus]NHN36591.1 maleylacetoacetate isomerase [Pseudomaricurvus alcaniphilus]